MSYSDEYREQILKSVNKASFLLMELHRSGPSFGDTIQSIISASRLEEHTEVSRFAEFVYSIVEALNSGGLDPNNEDVKSVISSALAEIIDIIKSNRHAADPKIEARMKVILSSAKSDERDYVFNKLLKVLYVDEDRFAQSNIQKNIDKSIQIESCFSGEAALQRLLKYTTATNFDLVARNQDQTILLIILGSDIEENFAKIVDLDTVIKTMPGKISKYAVIFSEPREVTRSLLKRFGIVPILVENVNNMLEKFKENYTENIYS
jgi:hypothetical protein